MKCNKKDNFWHFVRIVVVDSLYYSFIDKDHLFILTLNLLWFGVEVSNFLYLKERIRNKSQKALFLSNNSAFPFPWVVSFMLSSVNNLSSIMVDFNGNTLNFVITVNSNRMKLYILQVWLVVEKVVTERCTILFLIVFTVYSNKVLYTIIFSLIKLF